ncbi:sulfatase [Pelagicoccus mobilis]|uniref:sulfatase n=1 Tax=Pelagicoccus mobilis TaxID=415221 RepID=UPI002D8094E6|nr:sulfatase [Pelagicoccus mobilis]
MFPLLQASAKKPNVLLIAVDDLNDWIGALNGHPDTKTPNIDRLARRGTLFSNAHCQAPICNPSRTSLMFGMRPSTTGFYDNKPNSAQTPRFYNRHVSMPRHFGENGYLTMTTGKLYHASKLPKGDFEVEGPRPGQWIDYDEPVQTDRPDHMHWLWDFGPQSYEEEKFADYTDASWAIDQLEKNYDRPFFLSLGFYRPHVPFFSPERVYNHPDLAGELQLPLVKSDDLDDISEHAKKIIYSPYPASQDWVEQNDNEKWYEAMRAYLACIRWTDEQVGRVLDALDKSPHADNTIIVFYADHGFHLGEKRHWAKWTLWERSTRVPYIISLPGGEKGQVVDQPVELLSIYPTLIDLCGLEENSELEGNSVAPLLEDSESEWPHAAITTLFQNNHSVRTKDWRYISYADGSEELYDHRVDSNEWTNLAGDPEKKAKIEELRKLLPQKNVEQYTRPKNGDW